MVLAGLAGCAAALMPAVADACGGLIGENGTIELVRTTTLAAYSDGVERYVTAFEFTGEGESVGSIVPLPDVPTSVERGGDWTLQRLALEVAPPAPAKATSRRGRAAPRRRRGDRAGDADRRPRHHRPQGRRRRGRPVGAGERLPPHAGRPRGARLLRRPQPGVHGRQVRRPAGARARPGRRRQHPDHGDDPDRRPVGPGADPRPRPGRRPQRRGRRLPAHRPAARAARRRSRPHARAQRGGVEPAARRPPLRRRDGVGAASRCGCRTSSSTPTPPTSTTTSRCRGRRRASRRSPTPASGRPRSCPSSRRRRPPVVAVAAGGRPRRHRARLLATPAAAGGVCDGTVPRRARRSLGRRRVADDGCRLRHGRRQRVRRRPRPLGPDR